MSISDRRTAVLRLKRTPAIELPEGEVIYHDSAEWVIRFTPDSSGIFFSKYDWEAAPQPFALPTGLGAVIQGRVKADSDEVWTFVLTERGWHSGNALWEASNFPYHFIGLETLSEGVKL